MRSLTLLLAGALMSATTATSTAAAGAPPVTLASATVSLTGTSNVHDYTASTTDVRLTTIDLHDVAAGDPIDRLLQPGVLAGLEVTIPAVSLTSPRDGIDKNMHKALKVQQYPQIRFRLRALTAVDNGAYRAAGTLTLAGVEKDVTLNLQVVPNGSRLTVTGTTDLLMTDFGITPPKALMGMVKAHPKVAIAIDLVLTGSAN